MYPYGDGNSSNSVSQLLDRILDGSTFKVMPSLPFSDEPYFLGPETDLKDLWPTFHVEIATTNLTDHLGGNLDDYKISLSSVSPKLKKYEKLDEWAISECPLDYRLPEKRIRSVRVASRSDFILSLRYVGTPIERYGLKKGKILRRKFFNIHLPSESFPFPIRFASFVNDDSYPNEALWVIHWNSENFNSSEIDQIFEVVVNEDAREHLYKANEIRGSAGITWKMFAMDILTEVYVKVLVSGDTPSETEDSETLLSQTYSALQRVSGESISAIQTWVVEENGYRDLDKLRGYAAKLLNVVVQGEKS